MILMIFSNVSKKVKIFDIKSAAFVKKVVNAFGWWLDEFNDFEIVSKVELRNAGFEALRFEYFFLLNKNLLEVNLVYFLVSKIDTELFKTVFFEHFKAVNVKKLDFVAFRI